MGVRFVWGSGGMGFVGGLGVVAVGFWVGVVGGWIYGCESGFLGVVCGWVHGVCGWIVARFVGAGGPCVGGGTVCGRDCVGGSPAHLPHNTPAPLAAAASSEPLGQLWSTAGRAPWQCTLPPKTWGHHVAHRASLARWYEPSTRARARPALAATQGSRHCSQDPHTIELGWLLPPWRQPSLMAWGSCVQGWELWMGMRACLVLFEGVVRLFL